MTGLMREGLAVCGQVSSVHWCSSTQSHLPTLSDKVHQIALDIRTKHLDSARDRSAILCMGRVGSASNGRKGPCVDAQVRASSKAAMFAKWLLGGGGAQCDFVSELGVQQRTSRTRNKQL